MSEATRPSAFWVTWLSLVSVGVALFGAILVIAPVLARIGFSWLVYSDPKHIDNFNPQVIDYISLAHAVLGAVMFGWGVLLAFVVRTWFNRGVREAWLAVTLSVVAWFVPDTTYSLWSGFWPNAVLNVVFLVLFAVPLLATRSAFHGTRV